MDNAHAHSAKLLSHTEQVANNNNNKLNNVYLDNYRVADFALAQLAKLLCLLELAVNKMSPQPAATHSPR